MPFFGERLCEDDDYRNLGDLIVHRQFSEPLDFFWFNSVRGSINTISNAVDGLVCLVAILLNKRWNEDKACNSKGCSGSNKKYRSNDIFLFTRFHILLLGLLKVYIHIHSSE